MDHGIPMTPAFVGWGLFVPVTFFGLVGLFRVQGLWPEKTRKGSRASDIMAFEIMAGLCVLYLAVFGSIAFFDLMPDRFDYNAASGDVFYGKSQFIENHLIAPMISYQFWNFLLCLFNADLFDPAMIGHHLVTGSLAYFGLAPYLHGRASFFFGAAEWSNVPLTFVDIFKYFPDLKARFPMINEVSRVMFALFFIILRLIIWPYVSYNFWLGSYDLLSTGKAHSNFVVAFFLGANFFLTFLQFFWGSKIFGFLFKSDKKSKDGKKSK